MSEGQLRRGRGRPPAEIDADTIEKLGELDCRNIDLAHWFGVSERTIENHLRKPELRTAFERGKCRVDAALRKKQVDMALAGDRTMLIWLGKQRLQQKEKIESDSKVTSVGPPPIINVTFVDPEPEEGES